MKLSCSDLSVFSMITKIETRHFLAIHFTFGGLRCLPKIFCNIPYESCLRCTFQRKTRFLERLPGDTVGRNELQLRENNHRFVVVLNTLSGGLTKHYSLCFCLAFSEGCTLSCLKMDTNPALVSVQFLLPLTLHQTTQVLAAAS